MPLNVLTHTKSDIRDFANSEDSVQTAPGQIDSDLDLTCLKSSLTRIIMQAFNGADQTRTTQYLI